MLYGHNEDIAINFYNDRVKEVIAEGDYTNPFTYVPIRAGQVEVIAGDSGSAVVFGDITEGYDPIAINIEVEKEYTDIETESAIIPLHVDKNSFNRQTFFSDLYNAYYVEVSRVYRILIPFAIRTNALYFINVEGVGTASYLALAGNDADDVGNGLRADAITKFGADNVEASPVDYELLVYGDILTFWGNEFMAPTVSDDDIFPFEVTAYILDTGLSNKFPILKYGSTHDFGIVYKDIMGRRCSVIRNEDMSFYLPFYCENADVLLATIAAVTFKINHIPPSWAESYEIVYAGNASLTYWLQIRIDDISSLGGDRFAINIQSNLDYTRTHNMRWKVPDYVWEDGDRIRLIAVIDNTLGTVTEYVTTNGHVYDYEIEETASTEYGDVIGGDWLVIQAETRPTPFDGSHTIIAEIYRVKKGIGKSIYRSTGMAFEVGTDDNGNKYHKGDIDQVVSEAGASVSPAQVYNTANDSWKYQRINYAFEDTALYWFWAESIAASDWWRDQDALTSQSWPYLYDLLQRQVQLGERLRHGGYVIEGSRINNIAWFTYADFVDLPQKFGRITGMREIGFTLKVLQLYKETSIYIQRVQTFSADGGSSDYSLIKKLLGTVRQEAADFGCQHPECILVNDRNLYYWDNNTGKYIRSAPNGQIAISDYKMKRWFRDLSSWIAANGGSQKVFVNSGANVEHNEIWVNWNIDGNVWAAIFSEHHGRWISRIDQKTECYVHLGMWFAHVYQQKLYIMNIDEGQKWLEWAGVNTVGEVEFVSNINPLKNKVFNALAVYADHQFNCNSRFIMIPHQASYDLMESLVGVWNKSEGIYYGPILKDQNSPGNFASENARTMNGREMRGRYCFVRLRTEEHDEKVRIFSVTVISTDSERSG